MHPIRMKLKRLGWKQEDLLEAVRRQGDALAAGHLSDILNGKRPCSIKLAEVLSRALDGKVKPAAIAFWKPATLAASKRGRAA